MFSQTHTGVSNRWMLSKQEVGVVSTSGEKLIEIQNTLVINIDFSELNLEKKPFVTIFLSGKTNHWEAKGITAIYSLTKKGFRVYIYYRDGITPQQAKKWEWKLHWKVN